MRRLAISLLALTFAFLTACSGSDEPPPPPQSVAPAQTAKNVAAVATNVDAPVQASAELTITSSEPVDEKDDAGAEPSSVTATAQTLPALKLASTATPEPKPAPSSFKEGVHYRRLIPTQPTSVSPGQVEVVEIFWYGCPHCFALDPKLENWRKKDKPNYVVFQRIPATWNDATVFHGRVFYTAELLGKLDELHEQIFREVHLNGNLLNTMDKSKAFFTAHEVEKAEFDKVFASYALESKLQNATLLNKRYRVQGVPYFVINGKFTADVESAGSEERLLQLLGELAAREHGG